MILIAGSGPHGRNADATIGNHKTFLVLADYLSHRGIGTFRFDKRGCGKSTGNFETVLL